MLSLVEGERIRVKRLKQVNHLLWNRVGIIERWTTTDLYEVRLDGLTRLFLFRGDEIEKEGGTNKDAETTPPVKL